MVDGTDLEATLSATTVVKINPDFKSKSKRFGLREAKLEEKAGSKTSVEADRAQAIQGCIVRVLKSNKIMDYQEVVKMTEKLMLKFAPSSKVAWSDAVDPQRNRLPDQERVYRERP